MHCENARQEEEEDAGWEGEKGDSQEEEEEAEVGWSPWHAV